ncbi:hypothetical protein [Turicibacter sp.]|uniref:hypothetical protein n=1 Tax=Turicibacter sp. TaxID=2049042 RepID=UPI001B73BDF8|nr:hypothetical protein [Turicibacter sp.]MBP3905051.1 hypothetical protein [Turicibacter sp.]MBP3908042.1 hypothetical protein [Turicibacter sp.]
MKIYYGNKERSVELYNRNKKQVEQKMCYNNTFNILSYDDDVLAKLAKKEWKIAYCFFKVFDNQTIYVRHCCFLDVLRGEMIDATSTLLSSFKERQSLEYRLIHAFGYHEYIDALKTYHREPALTEYLYVKTEAVRDEMMSEGLLAVD